VRRLGSSLRAISVEVSGVAVAAAVLASTGSGVFSGDVIGAGVSVAGAVGVALVGTDEVASGGFSGAGEGAAILGAVVELTAGAGSVAGGFAVAI
jgi:hypothetical protein